MGFGELLIDVHIIFLISLCLYLWLCWVFTALLGLVSSCNKQGLLSSCDVRASHCGGFPCCGTQALECVGSAVVVAVVICNNCGAQA